MKKNLNVQTGVILFLSLIYSACSGQLENQFKYANEDSTFIYHNFLYYDHDSKRYNGVDERWVYEYWQENSDSAYHYYEIVVHLKEIPAYQKMIFASYFYNKRGNGELVKRILSQLDEKENNEDVYNIMASYGIPFSEYGLKKEVIVKCCPELEYK